MGATHRRQAENDHDARSKRRREAAFEEAEELWETLRDSLQAFRNELIRMEGTMGRINEVRIKRDGGALPDFLVIVKAEQDGRRMVGFLSGKDPLELIGAVGRKLRSGGLKMRDDRPWGEEAVKRTQEAQAAFERAVEEDRAAKAPGEQTSLPGCEDLVG